jgi:hypothetical protein
LTTVEPSRANALHPHHPLRPNHPPKSSSPSRPALASLRDPARLQVFSLLVPSPLAPVRIGQSLLDLAALRRLNHTAPRPFRSTSSPPNHPSEHPDPNRLILPTCLPEEAVIAADRMVAQRSDPRRRRRFPDRSGVMTRSWRRIAEAWL